MSELTTINQVSELAESYQDLSNTDLQSEIKRALQVTKEQLLKLAALVVVCDQRQIDLSDIGLGPLKFIRRIAYGDLSPELYVKYHNQRLLFDRISDLPLPDQEKLASGDPLPVYDAETKDERIVPPELLTRNEMYQVLSRHGIRDVPEQAAWLRERAQKKPKTKEKVAPEFINLDKLRGGINVNGVFIPSSDLARYLSELASPSITTGDQNV